MQPAPAVRLATLTPGFVRDATSAAAADWVTEAAPDAVVPLSGSGAGARRFVATHLDGNVAVLDPATAGKSTGSRVPASQGTTASGQVDTPPTPRHVDHRQVRVAGGVESLAATLEQTADETGNEKTYPDLVVTDALALAVDTTALSTTIEGREALEVGPATAETAQTAPIVISTGLPAGYRNQLAGLSVVGIGETDDPESRALQVIEIRGNRMTRTSLDPARLGLRALREVGETRAETLRRAGFKSRQAVANASLAALADLDGLGPSVAETIHASATAVAEGQVVRQTRAAVPGADPLFVDIETDGLHPTVTWLVGVLDGGPTDGTYRSFIARDPEDPGAAIGAFLEWYATEAAGRTLVAYNGRSFDFPVLQDHVAAYRPAAVDILASADRFDPYAWAIQDGHAVLPGRTNQLEDVAAGLGFEPAESGITGAAVARAYRRWLQSPVPENEPDWDRLDSYCEDDVRALARVIEALELDDEAVEGSAVREDVGTTTDRTTQGTLSEW